MRFFLNVLFYFVKFLLIGLFLVSHSYAFEEEKCKLIQGKACVDYGKRTIEGVETKEECWKYEEKSQCISKEKNECIDLESNRGCSENSAK